MNQDTSNKEGIRTLSTINNILIASGYFLIGYSATKVTPWILVFAVPLFYAAWLSHKAENNIVDLVNQEVRSVLGRLLESSFEQGNTSYIFTSKVEAERKRYE